MWDQRHNGTVTRLLVSLLGRDRLISDSVTVSVRTDVLRRRPAGGVPYTPVGWRLGNDATSLELWCHGTGQSWLPLYSLFPGWGEKRIPVARPDTVLVVYFCHTHVIRLETSNYSRNTGRELEGIRSWCAVLAPLLWRASSRLDPVRPARGTYMKLRCQERKLD